MGPQGHIRSAARQARPRQPAPESTTEGNVFELPGLAGGDPAQAAAVMGTMMELLQQKGGLGGLLDSFRASGLGAQADSWASPGPNEPVSGDQVEQALGSPIVDVIAQKLGLSPEQAEGDARAARAGDHEPHGGATSGYRRAAGRARRRRSAC